MPATMVLDALGETAADPREALEREVEATVRPVAVDDLEGPRPDRACMDDDRVGRPLLDELDLEAVPAEGQRRAQVGVLVRAAERRELRAREHEGVRHAAARAGHGLEPGVLELAQR